MHVASKSFVLLLKLLTDGMEMIVFYQIFFFALHRFSTNGKRMATHAKIY